MAYSEYLAERIRNRLLSRGKLVEKRMMGALIFMLNDKMCLGASIDKTTSSDRLMVRVGKKAYPFLVHVKGSKPMDFKGTKALSGFLYVDPEGFDSEADLDFWVDRALEFNKDLI
ncbi:MAG: TfoX/Sxy family protein [Bacteroidia bacterium]